MVKNAKNPHDALFKAVFSNPEHAAGELRSILPVELASKIDFSTLRLEPGSFVDRALRDRHTDLLYSARMGRRRIRLYVLCEHQSTVDPLLPFRLLAYKVRIWEKFLRRHPRAKRLPVIIAVVVHHSATGWTAPMDFGDLFNLDAKSFEAVRELIPRFRFILDDISHVSDEELMSRAMSALGRLALLCLHRGREKNWPVEEMRSWSDLIQRVLRAKNGVEMLGLILQYVYETNEQATVDELRGVVAELGGGKAEGAIVTLAERLRQEGREEGRLDEARATLRKVLVRRKLKLTRSAERLIATCTETKTLERWILQAIDAESLADALR